MFGRVVGGQEFSWAINDVLMDHQEYLSQRNHFTGEGLGWMNIHDIKEKIVSKIHP